MKHAERDNWSGPVHVNPAAPAGVENVATVSRLGAQREDIWRVIQNGVWYTLRELEELTGHPQASISARLRDFRKEEFGGRTIERKHLVNGIYQYRYCPPGEAA